MKYLLVLLLLYACSACSTYDSELRAHLEAERDFHAHQAYLEDIYTNYDPEYVDDCLYYEDLVCEFE
jgi:hypothetical protein